MNKKVVLVICIAVFLISSLSVYAANCFEPITKDCRYTDEQSCKKAIAGCIWSSDSAGQYCRPLDTCDSLYQLTNQCNNLSSCGYYAGQDSCRSCFFTADSKCQAGDTCDALSKAPYCWPGTGRCNGTVIEECISGGAGKSNFWNISKDCKVGMNKGVCWAGPNNNQPQCVECDQDKDGYLREDELGRMACHPPAGQEDCVDNATDCKEPYVLPNGIDWCNANPEKIHPGATLCIENVDVNCDGVIEKNCVCQENSACDIFTGIDEKCCGGTCTSIETDDRCGACDNSCKDPRPRCIKLTGVPDPCNILLKIKCAECIKDTDCKSSYRPKCATGSYNDKFCAECTNDLDCINTGLSSHCINNICEYDSTGTTIPDKYLTSPPEEGKADWVRDKIVEYHQDGFKFENKYAGGRITKLYPAKVKGWVEFYHVKTEVGLGSDAPYLFEASCNYQFNKKSSFSLGYTAGCPPKQNPCGGAGEEGPPSGPKFGPTLTVKW